MNLILTTEDGHIIHEWRHIEQYHIEQPWALALSELFLEAHKLIEDHHAPKEGEHHDEAREN